MEPSEIAGETPIDIINRLIANLTQNRRRTVHQMILIAEAGGACARCGKCFHPSVYDFHHRDPAHKSFTLDRSTFTKSLVSLRSEAKKCALLCANDHREVHTFRDPRFLKLTDVPQSEKVYVERTLEDEA